MKKDYYICPYCLTKFPISEVWFKCLMPTAFSKEQHEILNTKISRIIAYNKKIPKGIAEHCVKPSTYEDPFHDDFPYHYLIQSGCFKASKKTVNNYKAEYIPYYASCPYCHGMHGVYTHVCPNPYCNREIKINENDRQYLVSVVGTKSSGKTAYLGALMYSIDEYLRYLTDYIITLDEVAKSYKEDYIKYVKNNIPFAVSSDVKTLSVSFTKGNGETYTFYFYDHPSETFCKNDGSNLFDNAKKFENADLIIMNCDLSSFESVRLAILDDDSIDEEIKNNFKSSCYIPDFDEEISSNVGPLQVVSSLVKFLKIIESISMEKPNIPSFALCVTKSDLIKKIYVNNEEVSQILSPSPLIASKLNQLSFDEFEKNHQFKSDNLKMVLNKFWYEKSLVGEIDTNFLISHYYIVSSSGYNVEKDKTENQILPVNILDPFVHFMYSINEDFFNKNHHNSTQYTNVF